MSTDPDVSSKAGNAEAQVRALYDVDAIAGAVLGGHGDGYAPREGVDFWGVVQGHAL